MPLPDSIVSRLRQRAPVRTADVRAGSRRNPGIEANRSRVFAPPSAERIEAESRACRTIRLNRASFTLADDQFTRLVKDQTLHPLACTVTVLWPSAGELYWVPSHLLPGDPEDRRPLVVVETPTSNLERIEVITRTHDTRVHGVKHPADPANGCNQPGVFALKNLHRINFEDFVRFAERCGTLFEPYLSDVLDLWRSG